MIIGTIPVSSKLVIPDECTRYVVDNQVYTIERLIVAEIKFDYEVLLNNLLREWVLTEKGQWVVKNSVRPIQYHSALNPSTYQPTCFLRASLFGKDATFYSLKWRDEWK